MDEMDQQIASRAYHLWESEGRPEGLDQEHWERARFLVGIEQNPESGTMPNPSIPTVQNPTGTAPSHPPGEPMRENIDNLGEFPGQADQGEKLQAPVLPNDADPVQPDDLRASKPKRVDAEPRRPASK